MSRVSDHAGCFAGVPRLTTLLLSISPESWQVAEKHLQSRLLKNGQMQGTRNSEE
jgi:hypothetical protein